MNSVEIIKETREYYSDPSKRGYSPEKGCRYKIDDVRMCAVGRCITNPDDFIYTGGITKDNWDKFAFKSKYQGQTISFWQDLQAWHDIQDNFTETGISAKGEARVKELIAIYK